MIPLSILNASSAGISQTEGVPPSSLSFFLTLPTVANNSDRNARVTIFDFSGRGLRDFVFEIRAGVGVFRAVESCLDEAIAAEAEAEDMRILGPFEADAPVLILITGPDTGGITGPVGKSISGAGDKRRRFASGVVCGSAMRLRFLINNDVLGNRESSFVNGFVRNLPVCLNVTRVPWMELTFQYSGSLSERGNLSSGT